MCSNLLNEVKKKETQLQNFLSTIQKNLDDEREKSNILSINLLNKESELLTAYSDLSELQGKFDVIQKKFDTMKSIFA